VDFGGSASAPSGKARICSEVAPVLELPQAESPLISILVLTQDQLEHVGRCISSLARTIDAERLPYEVLLVFNGTEPRSVETFLKSVRGVRALPLALNLGFGGGNNYAAERARGEFLVFLNDDAIALPGWLDNLVRTVQTYPNAGAVGSRILFPDASLQEAGGIIWSDGSTRPLGRDAPPGSLAFSYVRPVDYISANGLIMRRADFETLGGFDSRYFPAYYEDTDLCLALRHQLQRELVYEPRAVIKHVEAASTQDIAFRSFLFRRNQTLLCEKWGETLATYASPEPESPVAIARAVLRRRGNPTRVLVVDDRLPDLSKGHGGIGSGFVRAQELFTELAAANMAITIYPADRTHPPTENSLASLGVDVIEEPLPEHLSRPEIGYDAVVVSRPHNAGIFLELLRKTLPNASIVYDAEALYHKRLAIQAWLEENAGRRQLRQAERDEMERLEAYIARTVDAIVAISYDEREWLEAIPGHAPVEFMVPLLSGIDMGPANPNSRANAVFVAGWLDGDDSPNVDALRWYCREVLPHVLAAIPEFRTLVTGKNPPLVVERLADENVLILGFVKSISEVYNAARIALAPIRIGAGVKNKTMEALQYGVPVVATTVGAEGMGLRDGVEIDATDDPQEFARRIVALATDDAAWLSRRDALKAQVQAWESRRLRWDDVIGRTLFRRGSSDAFAQGG